MLLLAPPAHALGASTVLLEDATEVLRLDEPVSYCVDEERSLDPSRVLAGEHDDCFQAHDSPQFGWFSGDVWVAFTVRNMSDEPDWTLVFARPSLSKIDLFFVDTLGHRRHKESGSLVPYSARERQSHLFAFELELGSEPTRIYARVFSQNPLDTTMLLYQSEHFRLTERTESVFFGWLFGFLFALACYNGLLWLTTRDRLFRQCATMTTTMAVFLCAMAGFLDPLFGSPSFGWSSVMLPLGCLTSIAGISFYDSYLELKTHSKTLHRSASLLMILLGLAATLSTNVLSLRPWGGWLYHAATIAGALLAALASALMVRHLSFRLVKYTLFAWIAFGSMSALWFLMNWGVIGANVVTIHGVHIGFVAFAFLLSLGLSVRINEYRVRGIVADFNAQQAEQRAQHNERYRTLLHVLFHDLANAIQGIDFGIHRLRQGREGAQIEGSDQVIQSCRRAKEILAGVREIDELDSKRGRLNLSPVGTRETIERAVSIVAPMLEGKSLEVRCDFDSGATTVLAEASSLCNHVFVNLLSNAIKFSFPGSYLEIQTRKKETETEVTIRDHGIGMPPRLVASLFDVDANTSRPGTNKEIGIGYGMQLVKSYMSRYQGRIEVESYDIDEAPSAHGTACHLFFRVPTASAGSETTESIDLQVVRRAYIVDDSLPARQSLATQLGRLGWVVESSGDVAAGLAAVRSQRYDTVFVDYLMPSMNGLEFIRQAREAANLNTRFVLVSATLSDVSVDYVADAFLPKPVSIEQVESLLRDLDNGTTPSSLL